MNSIQTRHPQGTFSGSRGLQLFYQSWYPDTVPKETVPKETPAKKAVSKNAVRPSGHIRQTGCQRTRPIKGKLAIVHGLGEQSGRYCSVVKGLTAAG
ncbi:MAG: hypothetical protein ACFB16_08615 [Phormidesmis sp.]